MSSYVEVIAALEANEARYLVVGGVAVNLHGVPRMTANLDLLVDMDRENLLRVVGALGSLGYQPKDPVPAEDLADESKRRAWRDEKNMLVFSFQHPGRAYDLIDILIASPVSYREAEPRSKRLEAAGVPIRIASIDDLVRMKRGTGRAQDRADIASLERLRRARED